MREQTKEAVRRNIRHGDMVKVMSGRSKGRTGKVLSVNPAKGTITDTLGLAVTLRRAA